MLGYIAEMDFLMGIRTPKGDTSLRPRVRFQDYPDRDDFERFEGFPGPALALRVAAKRLRVQRQLFAPGPVQLGHAGWRLRPARSGRGRPGWRSSHDRADADLARNAADLRTSRSRSARGLACSWTISQRVTTQRTAPPPGPTTTTASSMATFRGRSAPPATSRLARTRHAMRPRTIPRQPMPSADGWVTPIAGTPLTGSRRTVNLRAQRYDDARTRAFRGIDHPTLAAR